MGEPETRRETPPRDPSKASPIERALAFALAIMAADAISMLLLESLAGVQVGLSVARLNATWVLGRGALDGLAIGCLDLWWRRHPRSFLVRRLVEAFVVSYAVCVLFQTAEVLHYGEFGFGLNLREASAAWTTLRFVFAVWGLSCGFVLAGLLRERPLFAGLGFALARWFTDDLVTYVLEGRSTVPAAESGAKLTVAIAAVLEIGVLVALLSQGVPLLLHWLGVHTEAVPEAHEPPTTLP